MGSAWREVGGGKWALGSGRWEVGSGKWAVGSGRWYGKWKVDLQITGFIYVYVSFYHFLNRL